jgi:peptidoglycan/LPS O-acetylase OafA/YrhL
VPRRVVGWLGSRSYSIFLVHFPVCLVVNAVFTRFVAAEPLPQALGIAVAWASSVVAGALFHRAVEQPAVAWISARRAAAPGGRSGLRAG